MSSYTKIDNVRHADSQVKPCGERIEPRDVDNEIVS